MSTTNLGALSICLIEDDPDHRLLINRAIRDLGEEHAVFAASDGAEALAWLGSAERVPDLILLDINMPGLSGFDVLQKVKADERLKLIPVVMLTSSDLPADVARAYELGASGYISKPTYFHDLRAVLSNTLLYWSAMKRAASEAAEGEGA